MTIVIETNALDASLIEQTIKKSLSEYHLSISSEPLVFDDKAYHYYSGTDQEDPGAIIQELLQLPGINAAYVKPEGVPPSI